MSGVAAHEDCKPTYMEKFQPSKCKYRYLTFKIPKVPKGQNMQIVIDELGGDVDSSDGYQEFLNYIHRITNEGDRTPALGCSRYCIVKFSLMAQHGEMTKIIWIDYCPEGLPVAEKMVFASSKATLKQALTGIEVEIHASEESDFTKQAVENFIKDKFRTSF